MTKREYSTFVFAGIMVLAVAVLGVLSFFLFSPNTEEESAEQEVVSHEGHDHADPTKASAQSAAQAVMGAAYSWQPAHFDSPLDGILEVSDRLTDEFAEKMKIAATDPNHVVAKEWDTWAKNGDVISAATESTNEEIREGFSTVTVLVTQNVLTSQGDVTPYSQFEVDVEAVSTTGDADDEQIWLVRNFAITNVIF